MAIIQVGKKTLETLQHRIELIHVVYCHNTRVHPACLDNSHRSPASFFVDFSCGDAGPLLSEAWQYT
jgi:hypothetical protein